MQVFIQQLINGLSVGAVYALIALGYTMVYGVVLLITAIGISLFLENTFQHPAVFGPNPRTFPRIIQTTPVISFHIGSSPTPVTISNLDLLSFSLAVILMLALTWVVLKTKTGLA